MKKALTILLTIFVCAFIHAQQIYNMSFDQWSKVLRLVTTEGHYDPEADSHLIGRGVLTLTKDTGGYVHFEIPIEYRKDAKPTYVGICILSSALGEYFTGSSNTVLYVDEFQFNY